MHPVGMRMTKHCLHPSSTAWHPTFPSTAGVHALCHGLGDGSSLWFGWPCCMVCLASGLAPFLPPCSVLWLPYLAYHHVMGLFIAFLLLYLCCVPMVLDPAIQYMMVSDTTCIPVVLMVDLCSHGKHVRDTDHLLSATILFPPANGPPITVLPFACALLVQSCLELLLGFAERLEEDMIAHSQRGRCLASRRDSCLLGFEEGPFYTWLRGGILMCLLCNLLWNPRAHHFMFWCTAWIREGCCCTFFVCTL